MYPLNRLDSPRSNSEGIRSANTSLPQATENTQASTPGTLLWVGDRLSPEVSDIYRYCEACAPQLAFRGEMEDAIARPATDVTHLVINRSDRNPSFESQLARIACAYPAVTLIEMFGSAWEGHVYHREISIKTQQFYWHRWNQVLPPLLGLSGFDVHADRMTLPHRSVAIMAANYSDAEPLMDLATSAGAVSVWCRSPQLMTARNCSVIWWDDSVARPASEKEWRQRMNVVEKNSCVRPQHVWLANAPRVHQYLRARSAGVDVVFSKPHRIEPLISTLVGYRTDLGARPRPLTINDSQVNVAADTEATRIRVAA
tara:strand:- start:70318 stop:71259 length:942 start_codon:yes stop_codon:yes gene_type:complete